MFGGKNLHSMAPSGVSTAKSVGWAGQLSIRRMAFIGRFLERRRLFTFGTKTPLNQSVKIVEVIQVCCWALYHR